jgi:uncharacterized membrane protein (DUF4010 family)
VLSGYLAALGSSLSPLLLPATLLSIAALVIVAYWKTSAEHVGATTEAVALTAPLLGAAVAFDHRELAAASAVAITLLLTLKAPLHKLAGVINEDEILSIVKFGIVALVLLPLLPNQPTVPTARSCRGTSGWWSRSSRRSASSATCWCAILGGRAGWALTGLVGGLASSTAVTLSLSSKARGAEGLLRSLAAGILLANMLVYGRLFALVGMFDAPLLRYLAPRLLALLVIVAAFAALQLHGRDKQEAGAIPLKNPVELGKALLLGLGFGAILLIGRAAEEEFGSAGLWAASAIGGLVDVDSVALANARLHQQGSRGRGRGGRALLLATLTNLIVKGSIVVSVGGGALARRVLPGLAAAAVATAARSSCDAFLAERAPRGRAADGAALSRSDRARALHPLRAAATASPGRSTAAPRSADGACSGQQDVARHRGGRARQRARLRAAGHARPCRLSASRWARRRCSRSCRTAFEAPARDRAGTQAQWSCAARCSACSTR